MTAANELTRLYLAVIGKAVGAAPGQMLQTVPHPPRKF